MKINIILIIMLILVILLYEVFDFRTETRSTYKTYSLDASEVGHMAYNVLKYGDVDAAEKIGMYFEYCTDEYDFGNEWIKIAEKLKDESGPEWHFPDGGSYQRK